MNTPLKRNATAEALIPGLAELGDAIEQIQGATKSTDLKEFEYDDIGLGWCIHCGYTVEWDDGRAEIWILTLDLNTGQHLIPLTLTDIPGADLRGIEAVIAEQEESDAHEAALHLYRTRHDDGDYSLDAQRDKLAALEPDESR